MPPQNAQPVQNAPQEKPKLEFADPHAPTPEEVKRLHPMVVLRPGEQIIAEIKRHPIGIFMTYLGGALSVTLIIVVAALAPSIFQGAGLEDNFGMAAIILAFILSIGICAVMFIATTVYWQNRWIVTDDSITQITQHSLFARRVSQLSMESLEDVTVDQHGILQTMFNFGTLHAETAGEKSKFVFQYCPQPNKRARQILQAHEYFLHQTRHQPQAVHTVDDPQQQPPAPAAQDMTAVTSYSATMPQQSQDQPQDQQPQQQYQQPAVQPQNQQSSQAQGYQSPQYQQYAVPAQSQQYQPPHMPQQPGQNQQQPLPQPPQQHQPVNPAIWGK